MKRRNLLIIILLMCRLAVAQVYHFEHYGIHNGLGQSQVSDIIEDQFGYIWMSTKGGGLSRFDGINFKTYRKEDGLPSNNLANIRINTKQQILIGTYRGFCLFDGKTFKNLTRKDRMVRQLLSDKKNEIYLIFDKNGIGKVRGNDLFEIKPNDLSKPSIEFATIDSQNQVHFSDWEGNIYKFTDNKLFTITKLPKGFSSKSFFIDKNNTLWLPSIKGLYKVKNIKPQLTEQDLEKICDRQTISITQTRNNDIWVGMMEGAMRISANGVITDFNVQNGFTGALVSRIYEDSKGVIWFATDGDGAYKFTNPPFTSISRQSGLSESVVSKILPDGKGHLWLGTFNYGINVWDGRKISKKYNTSNGLLCNGISASMLDKKGNKWFGLSGCGVVRFDKNDRIKIFTNKEIGSETSVTSIIEGDGDDIWFGTFWGIFLYDGKKFRRFSKEDGLHNNQVPKLLKIDKNTIIAFTFTGANLIKDYKIYDLKEIPKWEYLRITSAIYDPKSKMLFWGDMEEGITAFNLSTKKKYNFTKKHGLSSNLIYNLILGENNSLWVGTEKGLDFVQFDKNWAIAEIKHYSESKGLVGIETNESSVTFDEKGNLWVGTIMGAFQYHSERDFEDPNPVKVQLTEVKLLTSERSLKQFAQAEDPWHKVYQNLVLPYYQNNLTFKYIGIYHRNPKEVVYQYKLEGFDRDWSLTTPKTEAIYTNLPEGKYTLVVRASTNPKKWSNEVTKYEFVIQPPFWRTWWFSLASVLSVISLVFISQRVYASYRTKEALTLERLKQEAESEVRKQIAQDFHDELGNRLAAITTQSSVLMLKMNAGNENRKIVSDIENNARKLYTDTKDFIWTIDPESNRLNELIMYIKDFGEKLFQYTDIEFLVKREISDDFADKVLPAGWSIQVIMIFKEAMTNALKHSKSRHVYFDYEIENDSFSFTLEDDGVGINSEPNSSAQKGIGNMQRRANKINCQLAVERMQPRGTYIRLVGKIPHKLSNVL
ncbi:MAG: two-component regulator propeller domain-containing protein [Spirosomataceae bacterium]